MRRSRRSATRHRRRRSRPEWTTQVPACWVSSAVRKRGTPVELAAVDAYRAVLTDPTDEAKATLASLLADDAAVIGPLGAAKGRDAVVEALAGAPFRAIVASASWSEPAREGARVS